MVAGRQIGLSSSAIGKAMARMEELLRVRLFHSHGTRHDVRAAALFRRVGDDHSASTNCIGAVW
jgi:DNA-binding transcriptional LysR family regulator